MPDATPTTPAPDQVTSIDILKISIEPTPGTATGVVTYVLQETWQSGRITVRSKTVPPANFIACLASFCQATPKKKFIQYLVSGGHEDNLTAP